MEMPDKIEIDCKYTTKGYLQVEQWSAKEGIRTPPINGNSRHKYYHSRIVEALKAENEELRNKYTSIGVTLAARNSEIAELKTWQNGARQAKAELDLGRIRLQDIIRDLEAKLDKAKWQPIESVPPLGQWYLVSCDKWVSDHKHQITLLAFADYIDDEGIFWISDQDGSRIYPTHWMPLPDAPVKL